MSYYTKMEALVLGDAGRHNKGWIMPAKNILAVVGLAAVALILAAASTLLRHDPGHPGISGVASAAAHARPVDDANAPVVRFVKDPEMAPPLLAVDILGRAV